MLITILGIVVLFVAAPLFGMQYTKENFTNLTGCRLIRWMPENKNSVYEERKISNQSMVGMNELSKYFDDLPNLSNLGSSVEKKIQPNSAEDVYSANKKFHTYLDNIIFKKDLGNMSDETFKDINKRTTKLFYMINNATIDLNEKIDLLTAMNKKYALWLKEASPKKINHEPGISENELQNFLRDLRNEIPDNELQDYLAILKKDCNL